MDRDTAHARIRAAVAEGAGSLRQVADRLGVRPQTVHGHLANMHDGADVRAAIAENRRRRADLHAAYGRVKTLAEWARDPRCVVSVNTLRKRVNDGWRLEEAMRTPAAPRGQVRLAAPETEALKAAADLVRSLPHVHRFAAADAPERAAVQVRNRLMREAARRASVAEIARVVGLTHGWAWECVHAGRGRNPGTA